MSSPWPRGQTKAIPSPDGSGRWYYGPGVDPDTRELRYASPTVLDKFNPHSSGGSGCMRKWFFSKVLKYAEDEHDFSQLGKKCHGELEHFMKTGENVLSRITEACRRYVPKDPTKVLIEFDIARGDLALASLRCAGVPFVGYVDLIHAEPAINDDGDGFFDDPPNTIEILDWKFGSAKKGAKGDEWGRGKDFSKSAPELTVDTQMISYGEWAARIAQRTPTHLRLSHVYTNTKGPPSSSKASILVTREHLARRWEYQETVVRSMQQYAREIDPDRLPANPGGACESFGGCSYRAKCSAHHALTLEGVFGGESAMGLVNSLNLDALGLGATVPAPPINPITPMGPPPGVPMVMPPAGVAAALDITAQMAAITAAAAQPAPTAPTWPAGFPEAVDLITAKGYGFPPLAGAAAVAYASLMRSRGFAAYNATNGPFAGSGKLAPVATVDDAARVVSIAQEMAGVPVNPETAPAVTPPPTMGIVAPDAPASNPALAADPVAGFTMPNVNAVTPGVAVPGLITSVPPGVAAPILAGGAPSTPPNTTPENEKPKSGKGSRGPRKPKATTDNTPGVSGSAPQGSSEDEPMGSWLFVNAIPNVSYENLQPQIDAWALAVARHYKCEPEDVRCAGKDGAAALAYSAWPGALTALGRRAAASLPEGAYYIDLRGSAINQAIYEGMRSARHRNPDGTDGDPVFSLIVRGHD